MEFFSAGLRRLLGERAEEGGRLVIPRHSSSVPVSSFCDNTVVNSKYTLLTFAPLNLWEQLHRPINLYFLIVGLVQFISIVSPVSPLSMLVPLGIGFGITAAKEAYDDFLRHREDNRDNARRYRKVVSSVKAGHEILSPTEEILPDSDFRNKDVMDALAELGTHLESVQSRDICVGDVVVLKDGEEVPCDLVAILSCHMRAEGESTDDMFTSVFVSTENLDGEADAKLKHSILGGDFASKQTRVQLAGESSSNISMRSSTLRGSGDAAFLMNMRKTIKYLCDPSGVFSRSELRCEAPNKRVNHFHGVFSFDDGSAHQQEIVLDESNLLVGGSRLRSTAVVFGLAVYTGRQTKGNLSKKGISIKWSQFDRLTTVFCIAVFIAQFVLVLSCGVAAYVVTEPRKSKLWYLGYYFQLQSTPGSSYGIPLSMQSDIINSWEYYAIVLPTRMFIMLTVLLPVSFKVMLEVSKYYISRCVEWDLGMCYTRPRASEEGEAKVIATAAKNSSLAEDLGQIAFVMTDKTGTLTRNEMQLRHLELLVPHESHERLVFSESARSTSNLNSKNIHPLQDLVWLAQEREGDGGSSCFTGQISGDASFSLSAQRVLEVLTLCNAVERPPPSKKKQPQADEQEGASANPLRDGGNSANPVCAPTRYVGWESPSPDESALVYGAHLAGASLLDRNRSSAIVRFASGGHEHDACVSETAYQLVANVPFTSERGKMSVIVRKVKNTTESEAENSAPPDMSDECIVLTKGADEKVLTCCDPEKLPSGVHDALKEYSIQGLRTLVFAWKSIPMREAEEWVHRQKMTAGLTNAEERAAKMLECNAALETGLTPVGLSAVEDRLQDGVPETITLLRGADVKVWMLTGDKIETAKQIGLSCRMVHPTDHLIDMTFVPTNRSRVTEEEGRAHMLEKLQFLKSEIKRLGLNRHVLNGDDCPVSSGSNNSMESRHSAQGREDSAKRLATPPESRDRAPISTSDANGSSFYSSSLSYLKKVDVDEKQPRALVQRVLWALRDFFSFSDNSLAVLREVWEPSRVVKAYVAGRVAQRDTNGSHVLRRSAVDTSDFSTGEGCNSTTRGSVMYSIADGAVSSRLSLLLNGGALTVLQNEPDLMQLFKPILLSAVTVICCRVAPDQKAFVVSLAKEEGHITLAIGDGGNDVAMIQEAHVGVGITGYEGRQAALAADFAMGQFRFLARLMLVHGHQAFQRSAAIVQYSFFKCTFIALMQVLYNCFTLMSGVTFWSSFSLTVYNSAVTIPMTFCFAMGTPGLPRKHLLTSPFLYSMSQKGRYMNGMTFFFTAVRGLVQSCVIFFMGKRLFLDSDIIMDEGRTMDEGVAYVPFYLTLLVVQVLIIICQTHGMTWVHWVLVSPVFGVGSFIVSWTVYVAMTPDVVGEKKSAFYFLISHGAVPLNCTILAGTTFFLFYAIQNAFVSRHFPNMLQLYRQVAVREAAEERKSQWNPKHIDSPTAALLSSEEHEGNLNNDDDKNIPSDSKTEGMPVILALEEECEDPIQGNDFKSLLRSLRPRL